MKNLTELVFGPYRTDDAVPDVRKIEREKADKLPRPQELPSSPPSQPKERL